MNLNRNNTCPNCGNNFNKEFDFCPHCGQKNKEIKLGFKYLLNDFLSGSFNIDSKFFTTFRYLLFKPAFLSKEFLNGKRTNYLTPLRIYLLVSLAYFTVISLSDQSILEVKENEDKYEETQVVYNNSSIDSVLFDNDSTDVLLGYGLDIDSDDSDTSFLGIDINTFKSLNTKEGRKEFNKKITRYISYAMFFIMPFAAVFLFWFFGRGTFYFEHLIFLIHLQSLAFLILAFFGLIYLFLPYGFLEFVGKLLLLTVVVLWIRSFYNFNWVKSVFSSLLFLMSYLIILGVSFVLLAWISLFVN